MSFRDLMTNDILKSNIIIAKIPYDKSTSISGGARFAPDRLFKLSSYLPPFTMDKKDIKPLKIFDEGSFYIKKNINSFNNLADCFSRLLKFEKFTLFIGGDHSISIATEKAFIEHCKYYNLEPVLFHLDAHADICDFYDNSYLSHATPVKRAIDNGIKKENVVLFGIRSYEDQEVEYLNKNKEIKVFSAFDINNKFNEVIEYINKFKDKKYAIHLSFDIDMIDPSYAPGTGTPEHFGVESVKALDLILNIIKEFNCNSMDLVEISPKLDVNDITSWLGLKILYEIFYCIKEKLKL